MEKCSQLVSALYCGTTSNFIINERTKYSAVGPRRFYVLGSVIPDIRYVIRAYSHVRLLTVNNFICPRQQVSAVRDHFYGDNNVWKTANQMFGISSRLAAIVELIVLVNNKDMFTGFEFGFFIMALNSDLNIGVATLVHVLLVVLEGNYINTWKALKFLIMDPVHILAGVNLNADDIIRRERLPIYNTLLVFEKSMIFSLIILASYLYVWHSGFVRNGWVLWVFSRHNIIYNLFLIYNNYKNTSSLDCYPVVSSGHFKLKYSLFSSIYLIEKTFKLYILLSNKERLVTGTAGELLVTFQVEKVFAAATFLFRLWVPERF